MAQVFVVGIAWYKAKDYTSILEIMEDSDVLPSSYKEWRKKADGLIRQIEATGRSAVRATIDPEQFPAWCAARGLNVDANARTAFANEEAYRQIAD